MTTGDVELLCDRCPVSFPNLTLKVTKCPKYQEKIIKIHTF